MHRSFRAASAIGSLPMPADQLRSLPKTKAAYVEPMDCLPVPKLPEGSQWLWEIKLDGYRAVAVKSGGAVTLYSRNRKILNKRFPYIDEPLRGLPDGTVVDGEIVALDDDGRPASIFVAKLLTAEKMEGKEILGTVLDNFNRLYRLPGKHITSGRHLSHPKMSYRTTVQKALWRQ
jgi:hypothetical protein